MPGSAQAWLDEHESELLHLPAVKAEALVQTAGLSVRTIPFPGGWITSDFRRDRINLWLTESGVVGSTDAG